ncbi:YeiH family putative sulfate export transporter [Geovibrio thiophilus]|uniref:YeiH family putative sulfate export transporter n=1 Tax=Geovibrio thiophilus TaxID=139438 RepID=A0A3R5X3Q1_9BACT|nr:YeiH family protein [Geovibrio thiophilus]QAR33807.1 YeiH family putative sulfate export transporter [Geovibrio thiophilus]
MKTITSEGFIKGVGFTALLSTAAYIAAEIPPVKNAGLSPVVIAIILGMLAGNTAGRFIPASWNGGFAFCQKKILRLAVILFGFRITFTQIAEIGAAGIAADVIMLTSTFAVGIMIAKVLKMDRDTAILCAAGSSICGAAAVMAAEAVIKPEAHKTAAAVGTVVLFGTLAMFLYPLFFGFSGMNSGEFGIYIGSTIHEVAQAVAAGEAVQSPETAVITKLGRVMLLAPFLLLLSAMINREKSGSKIQIPWFAFMFAAAAAFHTFVSLPQGLINAVNTADTFMLAASMAALGIETRTDKIKSVGAAPLICAAVMFIWLSLGGYFINLYLFKTIG